MTNAVQLTVEVNAQGANRELAGVQRGLNSVERAAVEAGRNGARGFSQIEQSVMRASATMQHSVSVFQSILGAGVFELIALGAFEAGKAIIQVASDLQTARVGLEAFTGSQEAANKLLKEIQGLDLRSVFDFRSLLTASQRLLAFNFTAEETMKTLEAISAAGRALGYDSQKLNDLVSAFGQIKAAGRVTGEEIRQLRNAGVPALDFLAKGFAMSTREIDKAVRDGLVPADAAIRVLTRGVQERFGGNAVSQLSTFRQALSNLQSGFQKFGDAIAKDLLPYGIKFAEWGTEQLPKVAASLKENQQAILSFAQAIGVLGAAYASAKLGALALEAAAGLRVFLGTLAANPVLVAAAVGLGAIGIQLRRFQNQFEEFEASLERSKLDQRIRDLFQAGDSDGLRKLGVDAERIAAAFSSRQIEGLRSFKNELKELDKFKVRILQPGEKPRTEKLSGNAEKEAERLRDAERRASELLAAARRKEGEGISEIRNRYAEYRKELGLTAKARQNLALAEQSDIQEFTRKATKKLDENMREAMLDAQQLADKLIQEQATDIQRIATETARLWVEQTNAMFDAQRSALDRRKEFATLDLDIQGQAIERAAALQAKTIFGINRAALAAKVELEQQKLQVEVQYLNEASKLQQEQIRVRANAEIAALEQLRAARLDLAPFYDAQIATIRTASERQIQEVATATQGQVEIAAKRSAGAQSEIIGRAWTDAFERLKRGSEEVFDALLTKGGNVFTSLANVLKNAFLTALRDIVSSQVARSLLQLIGGPSGGAGASGGGSGPRGILGGLGSLLGLGGFSGGGGGGFSLPSLGPGGTPPFLPGAPGGTGGFSGPVGIPGGSRAGGLLSGAGGLGLLGSLKQFAGFGTTSITSPSGIPLSLPNTALFGKFGAFFKSNAALAAGGLLAFDGLRRGGIGGLLETTAGGALIGFKFGGPIGAAIGAAIGGAAGLVRLFIKTASEKAREKIRAVYGLNVTSKDILQNVVNIAKQTYGGNLDAAIQSQPVRDILELYAMATGQTPRGGTLSKAPRPLEFVSRGGSLYEAPSYYNGSPLPQLTNRQIVPGTVTLRLDPQQTETFLRTGQVTAIAENPRVVQSASVTALASNIGRRETLAAALSPGLTFG